MAMSSISLPPWRRHLGDPDDGFRLCARLMAELGFVVAQSRSFFFLFFLQWHFDVLSSPGGLLVLPLLINEFGSSPANIKKGLNKTMYCSRPCLSS